MSDECLIYHIEKGTIFTVAEEVNNVISFEVFLIRSYFSSIKNIDAFLNV